MRFAVSFVILFGFWILLSGNLDGFHLSMGVICTLIVTLWTGDLLVKETNIGLGARLRVLWRFTGYFFWLLYQIVVANLHVVYVALHPKMEELLEPQMMDFTTSLEGEIPRFLLANSITLTPGTITVRIRNGVYLVHALTRQSAEGVPGDMEKRIKWVFEGVANG
ncbi:cation transporter [bacterium]|nr:cation transporter [bacterium]